MANSITFDSVSYTAVPDEIPDGSVPEYDEIIDSERPEFPKARDALIPAKAHPNFSHYMYCSTGPEPHPENNHDCIIVSLHSVYIRSSLRSCKLKDKYAQSVLQTLYTSGTLTKISMFIL